MHTRSGQLGVGGALAADLPPTSRNTRYSEHSGTFGCSRRALHPLTAWTTSPTTRAPEPIRYIGGELVRGALISKEDREDAGRTPTALSELVVALPRRLGLHIGR